MAFKLLIVIGATGNQGGSVVETFLKEPGWTIRGLTRNANSDAAQTLKERGVEMVSANLDDIYSLRAAFQDAHTIFSVLDFWTGYRNPANHSMLAPGQTMMEWAHDYEMQQGKNVFAAAAQVDGLERLIFSALPYATKWSGGKYTHVYHFDGEARAVEYARTQYPDLVKKTSLIQIGMYLSNMLLMPHYQPKKNEDGIYIFSTKIARDRKLPLIAPNEDTGPLTKALVSVNPGQHLLAYREWLTLTEFSEVWGRVLGVESGYLPFAADKKWEGLPDDLQLDIEEGAAYLNEFGFDGGDPTVVHPRNVSHETPAMKLLVGADNIQLEVPIHLDSVEDWIRKQDWSKVL